MSTSEQSRQLEQARRNDILVPRDFTIDIAGDMTFAANSFYPGYPTPSERLHMTPEEIDLWEAKGGRTADLPPGPYVVMNHPVYRRGVDKGTAIIDDGKTDFGSHNFLPTTDPNGYRRDERGLPIRPYDRMFLEKGAVEGIGFYRQYGPNLTADPVVFRQKNDKLQVLVINRKDSGLTALPGGMQDPNEPDISTATRELFEEAGIDLHGTPSQIIHKGIVWSDTRSTRHAWPETTVVLLMPEHDTDKMRPKAGDDAKEARWIDVSEQGLKDIFTSHKSFIKLSVLKWQEKTGLTVLQNGKIRD